MSFNGTGSSVKKKIKEVAHIKRTTSEDIIQRIKNGEKFTFADGEFLSLRNDRRMGKYIMLSRIDGIPYDLIDINHNSGGRRKKRHNTKKARRMRRRSTRKN